MLMRTNVALPMYAVIPADVEALWLALRERLAESRIVENNLPLRWPDDLLVHWQDPTLLLSQTCGYPLVTRLPDVQLIGCFHYAAPGCEGIHYRSVLVAREADPGTTLADFRHRRVICNSADSQSGYNALRMVVAPLSQQGHFFETVLFSGSHRQSLLAVQQGTADIAAIDCVTFALLQRHSPQTIRQLKIIGQTPATPGLPLITGPETSATALATLRDALRQIANSPEYYHLRAPLLINGFSEVDRQQYDVILQWQQCAADIGVREL